MEALGQVGGNDRNGKRGRDTSQISNNRSYKQEDSKTTKERRSLASVHIGAILKDVQLIFNAIIHKIESDLNKGHDGGANGGKRTVVTRLGLRDGR